MMIGLLVDKLFEVGIDNEFILSFVDFTFHVLLRLMCSPAFKESLSIFLPELNCELISISTKSFFEILHANKGNYK
jgi:hypothetical protein